MAFIHRKGPANAEQFAKAASTAIASNSALGFLGSGYVKQALAASLRIAGIAIGKVASTDDNYADNSLISVIVPGSDDIFEADVTTGTATIANVGKQYDLDTNTDGTAQGITVSGTSYKVVTVVGFLSASKVLVKFNGAYEFANKAN